MSRCHRRMARGSWLRFLPIPAVLACLLGAGGAADAELIRRVRGIIDRDETWAGHVMVTDDVTVLGATLTVEAGALVEFAVARPGVNPVLMIGEEQGRPAMLRLQAAPESPIVFRTMPGTNAGRIVAWLRPPSVARRANSPGPDDDPGPEQAASIRWRHVRFEGLGHAGDSNAPTRPAGALLEPAVEVYLGSGASLDLSNCEFSRSGRLSIELGGGTRATLSNNRMTAPLERTAVHLRARSADEPAFMDLLQNRAEAAVITDAVGGLIAENVLIGPHAALVLRGRTEGELTVRGNYVHNTGPDDDGRYCFTSDDSDAVVEANIFRGGSTCVFVGTARMLGNALIGAPSLRSARTSHSQTHQLVAALPPGAVFADNLLIGPAYSMLIPQPLRSRASLTEAHAETLIRNNVFDGLDGVSRGVHVNAVDRAPANLRVTDNVFLRVGAVVFDEPGGAESRVWTGHNACAPGSAGRMAGEKDPRTPGPENVRAGSTVVLRERIADLRLRGQPPDRLPDLDYLILDGRKTIDQLRQSLFDGYRPLAGSPLIGAGSHQRDADRRANIGLEDSEPAPDRPGREQD